VRPDANRRQGIATFDGKELRSNENSRTLLLEYLGSIRDPEAAASLFHEDGALELPFLYSLGVKTRYAGRGEVAQLVRQLRSLCPNFAFAAHETRILIETSERTFAEYVAHGTAATTGRPWASISRTPSPSTATSRS
jgi:hypothetical protein